MDVDVIVVGGSYAGLSAAMQLARARRSVLIVDAGQPRNRFAAASHGFFGQDGEPPAAMIGSARERVLAYPTARFVCDEVIAAGGSAGEFTITTRSGERHSAARIVLATGVRDELPGLPGLAERWGVSVLHCPYCHGYEVAGQRLGMLATLPTAHLAMLLPDWGRTTFLTNGVFTPSEEELTALASRNVTVEREPVVAILGDAPAMSGVQLADGRVVPLDALFVGSRTRFASPLAEQLGCAIEDGPTGPLVTVEPLGLTSVPGIYAAGDLANRMPNATIASASGVMAGAAAHQSLIFGAKP
jgi:thioredoxin reductase